MSLGVRILDEDPGEGLPGEGEPLGNEPGDRPPTTWLKEPLELFLTSARDFPFLTVGDARPPGPVGVVRPPPSVGVVRPLGL